ncbi:MAG: type II secretion system protein GspL, partial [Gammaproteobacteria bacterium]
PDIVLVPWTPGVWSLAREKNQIILRWGREQGCTLEDPLAEAVFNRLWATSSVDGRPREIVFYGAADDPFFLKIRSEPERETVTWTLGEPSVSEETSRGPLTGLNLLQGLWAPGHHRQETWTRWKPSIFLAAGWAGLLVLYLVVRVIQVNGEEQLWHARLHQAFHSALPGQPYVSPRAQIKQAIQQSGGRSRRTRAFMAFLARASNERPPTIRMVSLHYGPKVLLMHLRSPSRSLIETYLHELSRTTHLHPFQVHWLVKSGRVHAFVQYHLGSSRTP